MITELQKALKNQEKEISFLKIQNLKAREEIDRLVKSDMGSEQEDLQHSSYQPVKSINAYTYGDEYSEGIEKLGDLVQQDLEGQIFYR